MHAGAEPAHAAADPNHDQFEEYRHDMLERLASWPGPQGASPAEVAHLREELVGVIHRAQDIPGQNLDDAKADLQDRLDDKLHSFSQDQQIGGLQHEEQSEVQQHAAELSHEQHFGQFQKAIAESVKDWQPAWWGGDKAPNDPAALADLQSRVNALLVSSSVDPNKPLDVQENALRSSVQGLMQTFQNEQYTQFKNQQDTAFDNKFTQTLSLPADQQKMAQAAIISDRGAIDQAFAQHVQSDTIAASVLPTPPPTPEEMQASAERIAAREDAAREQMQGIDPSKIRTLDGMGDAFDHVTNGSVGDPLQQHHDPLGAPAASGAEHRVMAGETRADAAVVDPTGGTAAMHHFETVAAGGNVDPVAQDHFAAMTTPGHESAPGAVDVSDAHAANGGFASAQDPAHVLHHDPTGMDAFHHDPTGTDQVHHDPTGMDQVHHDPTGMDAFHHDPTGIDAMRHDPASAPDAAPVMAPTDHPFDDPNAHAAMAPDMTQHDAGSQFADPTAGMQHDAPAYEPPPQHDEPAPVMSNPGDDQY